MAGIGSVISYDHVAMYGLSDRLRLSSGPPGARGSELFWFVPAALTSIVVTVGVMALSLQAACALLLVALVVGLYQHDRRLGVYGVMALWLLAPLIRRVLELFSGYINADPLSVAPVLATALVAGLELVNGDFPERPRRVLVLGAAGFAVGLPIGLLHPLSALYTLAAYIGGLSALVIGYNDRPGAGHSTLRRVMLLGLLPIAAYGVLQRVLGLPVWDQRWLDSVSFDSIGTGDGVHVRVFSSLNSPGTLGVLLTVGLLCYLTVRRHRNWSLAAATLLGTALAMTYVRAAWMALLAGGVAHVVASRGRSARIIGGLAALVATLVLVLSPVSTAARSVLTRATTLSSLGSDSSYSARLTTLEHTLPPALAAPVGHGLGSAGEQSRLDNATALQTPDDGFLSLLYQVGPVGFVLVMSALWTVTAAAWRAARAPGPDGSFRWVLFAIVAAFLALLTSGDMFYGVPGIVLWYFAGQAMAIDERLRGHRHAAPVGRAPAGRWATGRGRPAGGFSASA